MAQHATDFKSGVPRGYKSFGANGNYAAQLVALLKNNPFFAAALTATEDGGFELKTYDPDNDNPSLYLEAVRTLTRPGDRVNFQFAAQDGELQITGFEVYDQDGERIESPPRDMDYYATAVLYDTFFFAEAVHSTIHVFHYLMTNALSAASEELPALEDLAEFYEKNVDVKYEEVGLILLAGEDKPTAAITGPQGFSSSQKIRDILKSRVLDAWGQAEDIDEFFAAAFGAPRAALESAGLLYEFFKHADLAGSFAESAAEALQKGTKSTPQRLQEQHFKQAQKRLAQYVIGCGEWKGTVKTIDTWIQLMGATGILHGSTLSFTRLAGKAAVMRWRNITSDVWEEHDIKLTTTALGTITGMVKGRHFMGAKRQWFCLFRCDVSRGELQKVLADYDKSTSRLKKEYTKRILQRDDFKTLGYIYSDWAVDGFDGKQLTVATYI